MHFRFSTGKQVIDIHTSDYKTFSGILVNLTTSYHEGAYKKKKPKPEKAFRKETRIDTSIARNVFEIFDRLAIICTEKIKRKHKN